MIGLCAYSVGTLHGQDWGTNRGLNTQLHGFGFSTRRG